MEKNVVIIPAEQIDRKNGGKNRRLRVAAYCRVSTDEERQLGSFENQIEYYTRLIGETKNYDLVKIYNDEGISGCSIKSRKGFQEMIADCEAGKIDLIITKSISRFARNTQDSLNFTRKLKDMGIGIIFEKEGINSLESYGELLLTLFSCFAQEESRSISENTAWGIRSKFQQGIPHLNTKVLLGYDKGPEGTLIINEEQAKVVRRIYRCYLEGFSLHAIASNLNRDDIPGVHGSARWCANTVSRILENEKYKGAVLMQKTFTANYLTKQHIKNTGQLNQYYIEENHPAIIPPPIWEAVQEETQRRRNFRMQHEIRGFSGGVRSPFYSKIFCEKCDGCFQRIYHKGVKKPYWQCKNCGVRIDEEYLRSRFCYAYNFLAENREELAKRWEELEKTGSPLQKLRCRQMMDITAGGKFLMRFPN